MTAMITKRIVISLGLLLAGSTSVLAVDAKAFADRLKDVAAKNAVPLAFSAAEAEGENVILKGLILGEGENAAKMGDVTFEGVTGSTAEGWNVATIPFADVNTSEGTKKAVVTGMAIEGFRIAGTEGASTLPGEGQMFFDSASVESVAISEGDKQLFTLSGTDLTNSVAADSGAITSTFALGDFNLDFAAMPADETTKTMQDLGYPQLAGSSSMEMSWSPKSGELTLDPFEISVENAGDFSIAYQLNGYTPAFAKSLAQIQEQMATNPEGSEAAGMAIIGLVSQLSVASVEIDYTDASLTGKLLDYFAKQNGQTRDELVAGLTGMLPAMLGMLQNPEFQTEVTTAVETFLKDPKSLTIAIAPDAPIAATQIIGAAMGAPQTLPTVLQLEVKANAAD